MTCMQRKSTTLLSLYKRIYRSAVASQENQSIMEDQLVKHCVIGEGSFGKVYMVNSKNGGRLLAVKSSFSCFCSSSLLREEEIIRYMGPCPHIIHCFGGYYSSMEFEDNWVYNLILEYAPGGTLRNLMQRRGGKLPESEVQDYARMILRGLLYMHQKGVVHCDLKPDNVLVFPQVGGGNVVKITDFGLAKIDGEEEETPVSFRGTPAYMPPESLALKQYDPIMDIWSLGCTVIEMVTGKSVWADCKIKGGMVNYVVGEKQVPKIPEYLSQSGKDFLVRCLERDPKLRWTAEMLLNHAFLSLRSCPRPRPQSSESEGTSLFSNSSMRPSLTSLLPSHLSSSSSVPPLLPNPITSEETSIRHLLSNLSLPPGWKSVE